MKSNLRAHSISPESKSARLPKTWPHIVGNGDVTVRIYKNKEAARIAEQKAQGAIGAAALSAGDRVSLEQALALLAKDESIGSASASRLLEIVPDYATARASLPDGVTPTETAQFYKQKHPANMPRKTVAEVVAEFIADRRSASCSPVHVHDLEIRLGQFSTRRPKNFPPRTGASEPAWQRVRSRRGNCNEKALSSGRLGYPKIDHLGDQHLIMGRHPDVIDRRRQAVKSYCHRPPNQSPLWSSRRTATRRFPIRHIH